jgi:hypothetical protein
MKPVKNHDRWARWCRWMVTLSLILMGSVIGLVLTVDPWQIYHPVLGGRPRFDVRIQRFLVPGLARTSNYRVALVGTSMLQNIPNSTVERVCGAPAVNLCIAGASIHEESLVLQLALKHKGTREVIVTLDYNSLSGGSIDQVIGVNFPFPAWLYDDSVLDKFPYYLSWDSIFASFHALSSQVYPEESVDSDYPWKFPASMKFDARNAVRNIDPADINRNFGMTNLKLEGMKQAFADNLFDLLARERRVRIHFVFPPYSILVWHDYVRRGQIPVYFAFKKWLIAQSKRFGNFDIVDFQDRADIITDLGRYADIYHYDESAVEQIVTSACRGGDRLNEHNFEARTRGLLRLVESTDPRDIVKKASGEE